MSDAPLGAGLRVPVPNDGIVSSTANPDDLLRTVVEDIIERFVGKGSMRRPTLLIDQGWMPELD